eukprot:tig00000269_g23775.t1
MKRAVVLGAGISGLSTAIRLLELSAGKLQVEIWTDALSPETTSDVAGALIHPYRIEPKELVDAWTRESVERYKSYIGAPGWAGVVREIEGYFLSTASDPASPEKAGEVPEGSRRCTPEEAGLPPGSPFSSALGFRALLVQTTACLELLRQRFASLGGSLRLRRVASVEEPLGEGAAAVLNCTGLAARFLAPDPALHGVRGQILRVTPPLALGRFYIGPDGADGSSAYVFPRPDFTLLGGTAAPSDHDDALRAPAEVCAAEAEAILARCAAIVPALAARPAPFALSSAARTAPPARPRDPGPGAPATAPVQAAWRPVRRGGVRLELERRGPHGRPVVHNYGHGGAGWTVAWGCASRAAALALHALALEPAPGAPP